MKLYKDRINSRMARDIFRTIKAVPTWTVRVHADNRMLEKALTFDFTAIIANGVLVEWHDENGTDRVVLEVNNGKSRDSVVLDLTTSEIVTAYSRDNDHKGRDNRKYFMGGN